MDRTSAQKRHKEAQKLYESKPVLYEGFLQIAPKVRYRVRVIRWSKTSTMVLQETKSGNGWESTTLDTERTILDRAISSWLKSGKLG